MPTNSEPKAYAGNVPVYCAFDEIVPVERIIPNPRNPNHHPQNQIELLGKIILAQEWRAPITVSRLSGFVVRGHGRYLSALCNKEKEVPVDYQNYASEAEEWADLIADNRIAELSEIDNKALAKLLDEIDMAGFPIELSGYDTEQIVDILDQLETGIVEQDDFDLDTAIEENPLAETRKGDLYIIDGKHRLYCGDSTLLEDVNTLMDGKEAQLCITDPPYNVDYEGVAGKIGNDRMENGAFRAFLTVAFTNMNNAAAVGAAAYIFHADTEGVNFRQSFTDAGFLLKQCLVWNKNVFVLGRQDYHWKHEPILYGWKEGAAHYFTSERFHSTVLEENIPELEKMSKEELLEYVKSLHAQLESFSTVINEKKPSRSELHPTMKPIPLLAPLILNSSKLGWRVLDLFGGSGSTLIACEQLGRICNIMEYEPRFCDVIVRRYLRWKQSLGQTASAVLIRKGKELPCPFNEGATPRN